MNVDERILLCDLDEKNEPAKRRTRRNYSHGKHFETMKKAIDAWQNKDPEYYYDENGMPKTNDCFATQFGIPTRTFQKYVLGSQATSTNRSSITIEQQFRWHKTYDNVLNLLRTRNVGLCRKSNKTFGEVIQHFIIGGDESNFMASHRGDAYDIGTVGKKNEKNVADSRMSVTAYRTGSVGGETGPTIILLAGSKKKKHYSLWN